MASVTAGRGSELLSSLLLLALTFVGCMRVLVRLLVFVLALHVGARV